MFVINIADLNIGIDNKYNYLQKLCQDYIVEAENTDFYISLTDAEIEKEQTNNYPKGYLESLAVYRKIADKITEYNGFLMHAAVIDVIGCGIAFLARSGVGKTTHMLNWKSFLGDKVKIINGDKPLVRIIDGKIYAYGTPWLGKENLGINSRTEIKKFCFIERADVNECVPVLKDKAFDKLISQVYIDKKLCIFDMLNLVIDVCDFYSIKCNTDVIAAKIVYEGIGI